MGGIAIMDAVEEFAENDAKVKYTEVPFSLQIGPDHSLYTQMKGENNLADRSQWRNRPCIKRIIAWMG
ncbi:hypothetical protein DP73_11435 [Desulfosporosinus sp. HMP52]|uniref:hypothetical protein n=1 Tax=Desulfosporosinus sp. HMP52 TaxID=1487923 RepID=UPI00051FE2E0|nr:hypothetical protein [Desulfosporosinus sp. HMP52]KGK89161.1 hypothetical protein DP73_11435 [Desulfosporosinus sp. HMP52]